ncbi:uncharacterized protein B0T23DRAFT_91757 [Neurospora hispaniola]|uniref:Uncharacterized protein n=1 Tax=Neurospora hispaniola TaxID=588809 RepID=A0AAJ0IDF4_9PEZI|nr:hypothetical protein B0T23DRAFT_91757 [Neurospora hispaniola]
MFSDNLYLPPSYSTRGRYIVSEASGPLPGREQGSIVLIRDMPGSAPDLLTRATRPRSSWLRRKEGRIKKRKTSRGDRREMLVGYVDCLLSITVNPGDFLSSSPQTALSTIQILLSLHIPSPFRGTGGRLLGGNSLFCGVSVGRHTWSPSYSTTTPGQAGRR